MQIWISFFRLLLNGSPQKVHRYSLTYLKPLSCQGAPTASPCPAITAILNLPLLLDLLVQQQNCFKHLRSPVPQQTETKYGHLKSGRGENSSSLAYDIRESVQKSPTKSISMMKIDFSPFLFSHRKRWIMCFIWPIKRHKSIHFIIKIIPIFITTSHRK